MPRLTIFSTFRPDAGPRGITFENAARSWSRIEGEIEILFIGRDPGLDAAAVRMGGRHIPDVDVSDRGIPTVSGLFTAAQREARHDLLCYVNADILLPPGFATAVETATSRFADFLMVGRRTNLRVDGPIPDHGWSDVWARAAREGVLEQVNAIDYFAFRCGHFSAIPKFEIGRVVWDNWMIGNALARGAVVDASADIMAVHQDHDPGRTRDEGLANHRLRGRDAMLTIASAPFALRDGRIMARPWPGDRLLDGIRGRAQNPGPLCRFWRSFGGLG